MNKEIDKNMSEVITGKETINLRPIYNNKVENQTNHITNNYHIGSNDQEAIDDIKFQQEEEVHHDQIFGGMSSSEPEIEVKIHPSGSLDLNLKEEENEMESYDKEIAREYHTKNITPVKDSEGKTVDDHFQENKIPPNPFQKKEKKVFWTWRKMLFAILFLTMVFAPIAFSYTTKGQEIKDRNPQMKGILFE